MLTLMVAKWVGDIFNEGLYDIHIHLRKIPILEWCALPSPVPFASPLLPSLPQSDIDCHREPPETMRKFAAKNVMNTPAITLPPNPAVRVVVQVLEHTKHHGFPVVDRKNRFIGLILRQQLITLLQKRDFRDTDRVCLANSLSLSLYIYIYLSLSLYIYISSLLSPVSLLSLPPHIFGFPTLPTELGPSITRQYLLERLGS